MIFEDWGLADYESSVTRQAAYVDSVSEGGEERLIFCTHPPVVTLGRGSQPADLIAWSGATVESSRGGRATYHGPSQLVIYPILDLRREHKSFASRDIHAYLRTLEQATVLTLREAGLSSAEARTTRDGELSLTGVWIGEHKIASLGIAVRKWVTYHGVAINVDHDAKAFQGIRPCGFTSAVMTSVEKELKRDFSRVEFHALARRIYASALA